MNENNKNTNNTQLHRVSSPQNHPHSKAAKKRKRKRFWRIFLLVILIFFALVAIYLVAGGYAGQLISLHNDAVEKVADSDASTFEAARASVIYDKDGAVLAEIGGTKQIAYLESDEIPAYVKQAFVSIEDKRFYEHPGYDIKGILRAFWAMVRNNGAVTQGGSTITQQLARNVFLSYQRSWQRKVEEIFIAVELEKKYSKDQILTFYINNINYMNGYYGIGAAANGYFNQDVSDLDLAQIAFLCAIPNSPTYYDPIEHYDHTITRQRLILKNMYQDGDIDKSTYDKAVAETITLTPGETDQEFHNYTTTYARYCAVQTLMAQDGFTFQYQFDSEDDRKKYEKTYNDTYDEYNQELYSGGYQIYTSIDLEKQQELQSSIDTTLEDFTDTEEDGTYSLQSSAAVIDNSTGMVVAIVGGRSQDSSNVYTLNRAFQSYRQPGSSIKPLVDYTPILETDDYTPDTMVDDQKMEDGPSNSHNRYYGRITLRRAVEVSSNVVAWNVFKELTPAKGLSYLYKMDFHKISSKDLTLAAGIGGLTYGVTPVEMAKGYATIENDGKYRDPSCVQKIINAEGKTIYKNENDATRIYTQEASREMTNILEGVITSGTGKGLSLGDQPSAGKTGTTNDNKDGWFVGYTPYYTTSVWVGYDTPKALNNLYGGTYPGKIWQSFMEKAHDGLEVKDFEQSEYETTAAAKAKQQADEAAAQAEAQAQADAQAQAEAQAQADAAAQAQQEQAAPDTSTTTQTPTSPAEAPAAQPTTPESPTGETTAPAQ